MSNLELEDEIDTTEDEEVYCANCGCDSSEAAGPWVEHDSEKYCQECAKQFEPVKAPDKIYVVCWRDDYDGSLSYEVYNTEDTTPKELARDNEDTNSVVGIYMLTKQIRVRKRVEVDIEEV